MTETVHSDYEVSSERPTCHWEIPVARLTDITPTPTNAAEVVGLLPGIQLSGTILSILPLTPATATFAVIDFTPGMVYMHDVRNVRTYNGGNPGAELGFGALDIGDPVYYDSSTTMVLQGIFLSTSPLDNTGAGIANSEFGWIVPAPATFGFDTDSANYPTAAGAGTFRCAVMQVGAGG